MIIPQSLSEEMLFNTVRLKADNSTGTGFYCMLNIDNKTLVPVIVTNKHVINDNDKQKVILSIHLKNGKNPSDENMNILLEPDWYFHPSQDLCFCFAYPIFQKIKSIKQKEVYFSPVTEDLIWDDSKLAGLSAIENVVMVGYPNGLWDEKNNLPLFRKGVTASHPSVDFNNRNIAAVDMACFPGSSGSPIYILDENGYTDKRGRTFLGLNRLIFLGVLARGPQFNAEGELIIEDIPTQQKVTAVTPVMINLGYYIKAVEILVFKDMIRDIMAKNPQEAQVKTDAQFGTAESKKDADKKTVEVELEEK